MLIGQMDLKNAINVNAYRINALSDDQDYYIFPAIPSIKSNNGEVVVFRPNYINSAACETLAEFNPDARAEFLLNFPLTIASIVEAKGICDSLNADFYIVYVPTKSEVYADELCRKLAEPQRTIIREKMNTLHNSILAACDSLDIKVIDLLPECIRLSKKSEQLYYNLDSHFNEIGHKVWAEIIYNYLNENK